MEINDKDKQWFNEAGMVTDCADGKEYVAIVKDPEEKPTLLDKDIIAAIPGGLVKRASQAMVVVSSEVLDNKYVGNIVMYMPIDKNAKFTVQIGGAGDGDTPKDALLDAAMNMSSNMSELHGWANSIVNA